MKLRGDVLVEALETRFGLVETSWFDEDAEYGQPALMRGATSATARGDAFVMADCHIGGGEGRPLQLPCGAVAYLAAGALEIQGVLAGANAGPRGSAVVAVPGARDELELYDFLVSLYREASTWHERLDQICLSGGTVQELLDESLPMFGNPLIQFEEDFGNFTYSISEEDDLVAEKWVVDHRRFESGDFRISDVRYESSWVRSNPERAFETELPLSSNAPHASTRVLSCYIAANGMGGYVAMVLIHGSITHTQRFYLEVLAHSIAVMYEGRARASYVRGSSLRALVTAAADGANRDELAMGFGPVTSGLLPPFRCLEFVPAASGNQVIPGELACAEVERSIPHSHAAWVDDRLIALVCSGEDESGRVARRRSAAGGQCSVSTLALSVCEASAGLSLEAGISLEFDDVFSLALFSKQAERALAIGKRNDPKSKVHLFEECAVSYIVQFGTTEFPAWALCMPGLRRLAEEERGASVDYLETLRCCFANNFNAAKTARELHIQRNTLLYRLKRIRDYVGFDLEDAGLLLYLQVSLVLMDAM
ncbi:MAG: helix-turn-helix domain-containing protein [Eggerthellaceae bacterium]|nr:helix-turn-helix domain-containing protein [Eggerthellaceae bacterium]